MHGKLLVTFFIVIAISATLIACGKEKSSRDLRESEYDTNIADIDEEPMESEHIIEKENIPDEEEQQEEDIPEDVLPEEDNRDDEIIAWHSLAILYSLSIANYHQKSFTIGEVKSVEELSLGDYPFYSENDSRFDYSEMVDLQYFTGLKKLSVTIDGINSLDFINYLPSIKVLPLSRTFLI